MIPGVAILPPGRAGWVYIDCMFCAVVPASPFRGAVELCAPCAGATHLGAVCLPTHPAVLSHQGLVLTHRVAAGREGRLADSGTLER